MYDKLSSFRFGSKLSTWIGSIAFNQSVNFLKKMRPLLFEDMYKAAEAEDESIEPIVEIKDGSILPDEQLLDKEKMSLLHKNIEQLPLLQRTIILLFHQQELSLEEIGTITSLPVNTVKSHLFRGRKTLKIKIMEQLNQ